MIVVSDTSAVSNLIQIRAEHLLHDLYGQVLLPPSVHAELRQFHATLPTWIIQRAPSDREFVHRLASELDLGEAEAIALAKEVRADWLLIDEKIGRQVARREGLALLGLGGVLLVAKEKRLIPEIGLYLDQLARRRLRPTRGWREPTSISFLIPFSTPRYIDSLRPEGENIRVSKSRLKYIKSQYSRNLERDAGFYLGQQVKTELLHRAGEFIPRSDSSS